MKSKGLEMFAKSIGGVFSAISWILYMSVFIFFKAEKIFNGEEWMALLTYLLYLIIPLICFITLIQMGIIDSMDTRDKKQRVLMVSIFIIFSLILVAVAVQFNFTDLAKLALIFVFPAIIVGIINKFWLISVHTSSTAISVTTLSYLAGWPYYLLFLAVVLVAWSRVYEGKHTVSQVLAGGILGIVVAFSLLGVFFPHLYFQ